MKKKKTLESSLVRLEVDHDSVPNIKEIGDWVCENYNLDGRARLSSKVTRFGTRAQIEVRVEAFEEGVPVLAAAEMFSMKIGNVIIYKRVIEYKHA